MESKPFHEELRAASGEWFVRETRVYFEADERNLHVSVDVWRPKRWRIIIGSVAEDGFIIAPDGSFFDE